MELCETYIHERLTEFGTERNPNYSLDRLRAALAQLGHPERKSKCVLVGGTNGKGSTTLLISAALKAHGYAVRTFTSPHLCSVTERFLSDLQPLSVEQLWDLVEKLTPIGKRFSLSYFEFLTLIFFEWCATEPTDWAIVEVGLGGKLDATNLCEPLVSVLTNVDLDHQEYLGNTREIILADKIQITRTGKPCITGIEDPALLEQARTYCAGRQIPLHQAAYAHSQHRDWETHRLRVDTHTIDVRDPSEASRANTGLAYQVIRTAFPEIAVPTIQKAFAAVRFPGRFEVLPGKPRRILCGAHNLHGIESTLRTLARLPRHGPLNILCSFSGDKPYRAMLDRLGTLTNRITVTANTTARTPVELDVPAGIAYEPSLSDALAQALPPQTDGTLLVIGSLYLIGEVRRFWELPVTFLEERPTATPPLDS